MRANTARFINEFSVLPEFTEISANNLRPVNVIPAAVVWFVR